ncbi:MAG: fumarylacetoacetate hydrolase family protein [Candidatus Latescibacterota bacterium]
MRIIRFIDEQGGVHLGLQTGEREAQVLEGGLFGPLRPAGRTTAVARLLAPVEPVNIYCIGLNYRGHAAESGMAPPVHPVVFMKPTTTLCHPGQPIHLPACRQGDEVDYECELGVVIGRPARDVPAAQALQHVLGYTCGNDVSARRWQAHGGGGQWVRGKGFDTFCPLGPVLVTADEIPDPQGLPIRTLLNGQVMQSHTTGDMIFSVAQLIAFLSQDTTLLPGTLIMTGTPQGVGFARQPPVWLKAGDEVVVEIDGIGRLANPVAEAV